ncbi:MAG: hypothetical protein IJ572_05240 [Bacilli bacterium]|nr:hypothetical protein [Bacilli bacterium]
MDRIYLNDLFDLYRDLLSEKECLVFIDYYQNDLSLKEIAENNNVTRNAIHKNLKNVENKLLTYEEKLNLYKKRKQILELIDKNDIIGIKKII